MAQTARMSSRQFSESWLPNGMQVVLISDPDRADFGVQFSVNKGYNQDPEDISGLAYFVSNAVLCGSAKYHGVTEFQDFLEDKEIRNRRTIYPNSTNYNAIVSEPFLEEYLDRLANMVEEPDLPKGSLEQMEQHFANLYFQLMNDDSYRAEQILSRLIFKPKYLLIRKLVKRDDLLRRAHEWISRYWRPSQMYILICGNMSIDAMKQRVVRTFGRILDVEHKETISSISSSISSISSSALTVHDKFARLSVGNARLARIFTKNEEKLLRVNFQIPSHKVLSPTLYYAYLINSSQPGSLQYKLKTEKLAVSSDACCVYYSPEYSSLRVDIHLTEEGSVQLTKVLAYLRGYIEILRSIPPQFELFQQAKEYFQYHRVTEKNDFVSCLERYSTALCMGYHGSELQYDETPFAFEPEEITKVRDCLRFENCIILAFSDKYVDTKTHLDNEFFLQYTVSEPAIDACLDGMKPPQIDPLVGGYESAFSVESRFDVISKSPLPIYHLSIDEPTYSMVRVGILSLEFKKISPPAQRLYAAMIAHKIWLLHNGVMLNVNVKVVDDALELTIKSAPYVLPRLLCLIVEYLRTPIGDEHLHEFLRLKESEEHLIDSWYAGDPETQFGHRLDEILSHTLDLATQREQLRALRGPQDLPSQVKGKIFAIIGGNIPSAAARGMSQILSPLNVNGIADEPAVPITTELSPLPSSSDLNSNIDRNSPNENNAKPAASVPETTIRSKKTLACANFEGSAILKAFDFGKFTHTQWSALLVITQLCNWLLPHTLRTGFSIPRTAVAKAVRKEGHMWLVFEVISSAQLERVVFALKRCIFEDIAGEVAKFTESKHAEIKENILAENFPDMCELDEQLRRIWKPLWQDPKDVKHFKKLKTALLTQDAQSVRTLFESKVLSPKGRNDVTVLFRPFADDCFSKIRQSDERLARQITSLYRPIYDSTLFGSFGIGNNKSIFAFASSSSHSLASPEPIISPEPSNSAGTDDSEKPAAQDDNPEATLRSVIDIISHYS